MSDISSPKPFYTYLVIKEYILKEIVLAAGPESISLEFVEFDPEEAERSFAVAEDGSTPTKGIGFSYFPKGTIFPDKERKFICLVKGRNEQVRRALINQRGQTRFLSSNAAISLMRDLKQNEAKFILPDNDKT